MGDIDQDGDVDILITNRGTENEICLNNGKGDFTETRRFGSKDDSTIDVEIADMNQDGFPDLILANRDGQQNYIYLNDGETNFLDKIPFGSGKDETRALAVVDLNQDGYLDIAQANIGQVNAVYFGSKTMDFKESIAFGLSDGRSYSIAVDDLNLDGTMDLIVGNARQTNAFFIFESDENSLKRIALGTNEFDTYDILTGDLNGDGKPEIIEANSNELNLYYANAMKAIKTSEQPLTKLKSQVHSWSDLTVDKKESGVQRAILSGSTTHLKQLEIHATTLSPGQSPHAPHKHLGFEELIIIKEGQLEITIEEEQQILGPGSVALILPGDEHGFRNAGKNEATYYVMKYHSKKTMNLNRGRRAGGSFMIDWNEVAYKEHKKGGSQKFLRSTYCDV